MRNVSDEDFWHVVLPLLSSQKVYAGRNAPDSRLDLVSLVSICPTDFRLSPRFRVAPVTSPTVKCPPWTRRLNDRVQQRNLENSGFGRSRDVCFRGFRFQIRGLDKRLQFGICVCAIDGDWWGYRFERDWCYESDSTGCGRQLRRRAHQIQHS